MTGKDIFQIKELVSKHFGLEGQLKPLDGEVDYNFFLQTAKGCFTIKLSRPNSSSQGIDFEHCIMLHLEQSHFPLAHPKVIQTLKGENFVVLEGQQYLRVQTWVDGKMLDAVKHRSPVLLNDWGKTCGLLSQHLVTFDHPAAHRFYKWNPAETLDSKKYEKYFTSDAQKTLANYFWDLFEQNTLPQLCTLRKSVNYSDAHGSNLLVNSKSLHPNIIGVIDFGDTLYSETINELAIACAYAGMGMPDPIQAMAEVVNGYHTIFPLEEKEVAVLFSMITARLLITVATAAFNKKQEPDNAYLLVSEKPAWDLLEKLSNINPNFAQYTFRQACNWEPCPINDEYKKWMATSPKLDHVISFNEDQVAPLDLSVGSLDLGNNANFSTIDQFEKTISNYLDVKKVIFAIGGYGEPRPFYTTDAYQVEKNDGAQWRTVHLGTDIWCKKGTPVIAPLDGEVHSFQNNTGDCNYGPTIILKHKINAQLTFYTLYGHLSIKSIEGLKAGKLIKQGEAFAEVGSAKVNGNWPPHLHFQVILDLLENAGDFPGVAYPNEAKTWLSICPDAVLNKKSNSNFFCSTPTPSNDKSLDELINIRNNNLGKSLSVSYEKPLHIVRGFKQYLYDQFGRRYLDTVNNVPHVGHQHPQVVRAAQRQIDVLNTNTRYLHHQITEYAKELLKTLPTTLSVVHFVNSGSEANELALRMAKNHTGQKDVIAIEVGYHGNTNACIDISSYKFDGKGGKGAPAHTHILPIPDTYRGLYRNEQTAGELYAHHAAKAIENIQNQGRNVAAFIGESIISCGGQIVLPKGYLNAVYAKVRAAGGLCIADEVQVGFGRVGDHFWGFELQAVVPDILVLGKPIGNGHPLAAVVCTQEVADSFANGMEFFNTFGGNPVSCAIGHEVLKIIKEEQLQDNAKTVGNYLKSKLRKLQKQYPIIGDIRGHGFFLGIELIKDKNTLAPAADYASYIANRMRARGILMSTDGPLHNVLKIKPPMCFDKGNADFLVFNLGKVLGEI